MTGPWPVEFSGKCLMTVDPPDCQECGCEIEISDEMADHVNRRESFEYVCPVCGLKIEFYVCQ